MSEAVMDDRNWERVSRERFKKFVSGYKTELTYDVCGIFDPPIGLYNDFSDGKDWPDSVVCYVSLGRWSHFDNPNDYFILRGLLD